MESPKECYVAFLDILGFGSFVMAKDAEYVRNYLSNIVAISRELNIESFDYDISIFSDSIIISVPVEQSGKYMADYQFMLYINTFLLANITEQRLGQLVLRGAITKGSFFTDGKDIIFGKALVEAHKLESTKAVYPRVLVDTDEFNPEKAKSSTAIMHQVFIEMGFDKKIEGGLIEFKEQNQDRYCDSDGFLCCNYLYALRNLKGGWTKHYKEFVNEHKNFIMKNLRGPYSDKVNRKYIWMKDYHNWFCSGFPELDMYTIK